MRHLRHYPILLAGALLLGWGVVLTGGDSSEARALLYGIGCLLLGAGLVLVILGHHDD